MTHAPDSWYVEQEEVHRRQRVHEDCRELRHLSGLLLRAATAMERFEEERQKQQDPTP